MRQNRLLCFIVLTAAVMLLFAVGACAENVDSGICGADGDHMTWTFDGEGTLTISGTGEMGDYKYASNEPWSGYKDRIKTVVIDNGVERIGNGAFAFFSSLETVSIADSVNNIGGSAFYECSVLRDITIPSGVVSVGDYTFYRCTALTSIVISGSVKQIGKNAFQYCDALTEVCYLGNETQWRAISISDEGNDALMNASIRFDDAAESPVPTETQATENKKPSASGLRRVLPVIVAILAVAGVALICCSAVLSKRAKAVPRQYQ